MLIASANHCVYNQQFCTGFSNRINVLQDAQTILITPIMQDMLEQVSVCSAGDRLNEIAAPYVNPAFEAVALDKAGSTFNNRRQIEQNPSHVRILLQNQRQNESLAS